MGFPNLNTTSKYVKWFKSTDTVGEYEWLWAIIGDSMHQGRVLRQIDVYIDN